MILFVTLVLQTVNKQGKLIVYNLLQEKVALKSKLYNFPKKMYRIL